LIFIFVAEAISLADLNSTPESTFLATMWQVVSPSEWLLQSSLELRPFVDRGDVARRLDRLIHNATTTEKLTLLRVFEGNLVDTAFGVHRAEPEATSLLPIIQLASQYRETFGFGFFPEKGHTTLSKLERAIRDRLQNSAEVEMATSLSEVSRSVRSKILLLLSDDASQHTNVGVRERKSFPATPKISVQELNSLSETEFTSAIAPIYSPDTLLPPLAWQLKPFHSVDDLYTKLAAVLQRAPRDVQIAHLQQHPVLFANDNQSIAWENAHEQLTSFSPADLEELSRLDGVYRAKFGFPFVAELKRYTTSALFDLYRERLQNTAKSEIENSIGQMSHVILRRTVARFTGANVPKTDGSLTIHVLDSQRGVPASNVVVELYEVNRNTIILLKSATTNSDGRTDTPLLSGGPLRIGTYEVRFRIGDYFQATGAYFSRKPYFDVIPIRFSVSEPESHYHVPLLVSAFSYSTYRGS
jgi:2-oxo-4-hydroxy-4-carboxy-5-ureidoimidazoline decarboxylase